MPLKPMDSARIRPKKRSLKEAEAKSKEIVVIFLSVDSSWDCRIREPTEVSEVGNWMSILLLFVKEGVQTISSMEAQGESSSSPNQILDFLQLISRTVSLLIPMAFKVEHLNLTVSFPSSIWQSLAKSIDGLHRCR